MAKEEERSVWMRLGVMLHGTEEELGAVMNGDYDTFHKLVSEGSFSVDGDSYIPECCVIEYNEKYGTNHEICETGFYY